MASLSGSRAASTSGNLTAMDNLRKLSLIELGDLTPSVIFLSLLILLGVPGNNLVFIIFWRYFKASSTRVFVLSMAVIDLFTSVLSCPSYIIQFRFLYSFVYPYSCASIFVIQRLPVVTSGWLLVAVALDRRHRICHPLKRQLSPRQAVYLVIVSLILASVATFPFIPLRREMTVSFGDDQDFGKRCEITDRFTGPAHRIAERLTLMLSLALGVIIMISSYVHIGYQLYRQKKRKETASYTELQGKKGEMEDKDSGDFLAKDQEKKATVKTKDVSSGFISEGFVELSKDAMTTTSAFMSTILLQEESALTNMETIERSLTVNIAATSLAVDTAATSPAVDTTATSPAVDTTATSPAVDTTATSSAVDTTATSPAVDTTATSSAVDATATSPAVDTTATSSAVGATATSPAVDTTATSSAVDITTTSLEVETFVTLAGDSSTVAVRLENRDLKATKESKSRHVGEKIQSRTTLMMFVITVTAIVAYLPYVVVASFNEDEFAYCLQMERWRKNWCLIALLFININSIVNPFIYSFCNPAFRHKCCQFLNLVRNLFPVR